MGFGRCFSKTQKKDSSDDTERRSQNKKDITIKYVTYFIRSRIRHYQKYIPSNYYFLNSIFTKKSKQKKTGCLFKSTKITYNHYLAS